MRRTLVHLYGPFALQSYGIMIALGVLLFTWLVQRDPRRERLMTREAFIDALLVGIVAALIGGRLLFVLSQWDTFKDWTEMFSFWIGGFSILGTVLGILLVMPWYLTRRSVPVLPFLDLIAIYASLLQGISRIGCFFAGCCYGSATTMPWGVIYTDPESFAPLNRCIHPAQLYYAAAHFILFAFMYFIAQRIFKRPGQLLALYIALTSMLRFFMDFVRDDQEYFAAPTLQFFSFHQWIALAMTLISGIALAYSCLKKHSISNAQ